MDFRRSNVVGYLGRQRYTLIARDTSGAPALFEQFQQILDQTVV